MASNDLPSEERKLLLEILRSQRDIVKILFLLNINRNARDEAATLHTHLDKLVQRFDK